MPELPFGPPGPEPGVSTLPKPKKGEPVFDPTPLFEQINAVSARLRMNEERYTELRKKVLLVEQNMLTGQKKALTEIKTLMSDITDLKRQIGQIQDRMLTLIKELGLLAKKEDLDVMRKYLDLWEPVKFVTADQVEKIVEEKLHKMGLYKETPEE